MTALFDGEADETCRYCLDAEKIKGTNDELRVCDQIESDHYKHIINKDHPACDQFNN